MLPQTLSLWVWQLTMNLWFSPQFKNWWFSSETRSFSCDPQRWGPLLPSNWKNTSDSSAFAPFGLSHCQWQYLDSDNGDFQWEFLAYVCRFTRLLWGWASSCGELSILQTSKNSFLLFSCFTSVPLEGVRFDSKLHCFKFNSLKDVSPRGHFKSRFPPLWTISAQDCTLPLIPHVRQEARRLLQAMMLFLGAAWEPLGKLYKFISNLFISSFQWDIIIASDTTVLLLRKIILESWCIFFIRLLKECQPGSFGQSAICRDRGAF